MKRSPGSRFHTAAAALISAFVMSGLSRGALAAEPSTRECVAANEQAISLNDQHKLLAARESLLVCVSASCPAEVRDECARRMDALGASIPSIVFEAKDASGNDLSAVKVTMDGQAILDRLQGVSLPLDPGEHTFVFETAGQAPIEKKIIIIEGAKDRHESIVFGSPKPGALAAPPEALPDSGGNKGGTQRILGWTSIGVGAVGIGLGVVFILERSSKQNEANGICPTNTCPQVNGLTAAQIEATNNAQIQQLTNQANTDATIATVGFVAGGALAVTGLVLLFTAPSGNDKVAIAPLLAPGLGGIGAAGRF